jgi:hypothetical protein
MPAPYSRERIVQRRRIGVAAFRQVPGETSSSAAGGTRMTGVRPTARRPVQKPSSRCCCSRAVGGNHVAARVALDHGVDVLTAVTESGTAAFVALGRRLPRAARLDAAASARDAGDQPAGGDPERLPVWVGRAHPGGAGAAGLQQLPDMDRAVGLGDHRHVPARSVLIAMPIILSTGAALDVLGAASGLGAQAQ